MRHYQYIILGLFLWSCSSTKTSDNSLLGYDYKSLNFDYENSDMTSIELATEVMIKAGGFDNWKNAEMLQWNFLGDPMYYWDKKNNRVRVEKLNDSSIVVFNTINKYGKVYKNGREISNSDSLKNMIQQAYYSWYVDSYWLTLPFELLGRGATLTEAGIKPNMDDVNCDVIMVTFKNDDLLTGKFEIFVDQQTKQIVQWSYYQKSSDETPSMVTTWTDYEKYGNLWFASGRGANEITDIAVTPAIDSVAFYNSNYIHQ